MYASVNIPRSDRAARLQLIKQNFAFFNAPVGLMFCLDRRVGPPQWADLGMYMQTIMLLAVERGLATCAQESWSQWPLTIAEFLELPSEEMVFAGMALGYADRSASINTVRTRRESVDVFARLLGFPDEPNR